MEIAETILAWAPEWLSGVGLAGWGLLFTLTGVALAAVTLGYTIGRNRWEDARWDEALRPELEVSAEQRAALAAPPGAGYAVGPLGTGDEGADRPTKCATHDCRKTGGR